MFGAVPGAVPTFSWASEWGGLLQRGVQPGARLVLVLARGGGLVEPGLVKQEHLQSCWCGTMGLCSTKVLTGLKARTVLPSQGAAACGSVCWPSAIPVAGL